MQVWPLPGSEVGCCGPGTSVWQMTPPGMAAAAGGLGAGAAETGQQPGERNRISGDQRNQALT